MRSERTKACDISKKVKDIVWERDEGRCILCDANQCTMPNAHYIPRSHGGLGIEQNVVTLCMECHDRLDHSKHRAELLPLVREYLERCYPGFNDEDRVFSK